MQTFRRSGLELALLPEATVVKVICDTCDKWISQPEQKKLKADLGSHMTCDHAARTMKGKFRSMVQQTYGDYLWFQVLISTGSIPPRMLELANLRLGQKALEQKRKAPASSREPASAGEPTGSQHRVSVPKRQRTEATKILRAAHEENEQLSSYYYNSKMSAEAYVKLQENADRAYKWASEVSQASGHAYKLDGQAYGAPETGNFAILLADLCGELNINVAPGVREVPNRPATLRKR